MRPFPLNDYRGLGFPNYPEDDEIMIDCRRRKAEALVQREEEEKNPKLREERHAQMIAAGVKFVTTEEVLRRTAADTVEHPDGALCGCTESLTATNRTA